LGLTSAVEGACSQGFLNRYLQAAPLLEYAHNIQQSIGIFRSADVKGEIVGKGLMIPIGITSYTMGNASRVEESQEGIDEDVEQEGGEGRTLYCFRVQLDCCGGLTAHLNSHRRVFINAAE